MVAETLAGLLPGSAVNFVDEVSGSEVKVAVEDLPERGFCCWRICGLMRARKRIRRSLRGKLLKVRGYAVCPGWFCGDASGAYFDGSGSSAASGGGGAVAGEGSGDVASGIGGAGKYVSGGDWWGRRWRINSR